MTKQSLLTPTLLDDLSAVAEKPCVSLYLPTHRHHPKNQQDPIRFRRLIKDLRGKLQNLSADEVAPLISPFEALAGDEEFWNHTLDGLAVFAAPDGFFRAVTTDRTVGELTVVADTFHTKPLRRFLQSADRYQILALNLHEAKLFEGNRDSLEAIELGAEFPHTIEKALGEELTEPHQTVASYGGTGGSSVAMHHSLFHKVSHNSLLTEDGIKGNPDAIPIDELRARAWEIFEPLYHARLDSLADDFSVAKSQQLGLDDLAEIGAAAVAGRVGTLLIEAEREIPGRILSGSGNVHLTDSDQHQGDDLLDDLGEWVIKNGGKVMVVPTERMPVTTGAAAVCRY